MSKFARESGSGIERERTTENEKERDRALIQERERSSTDSRLEGVILLKRLTNVFSLAHHWNNCSNRDPVLSVGLIMNIKMRHLTIKGFRFEVVQTSCHD